jgi:hypothetical protein
VTTAYDQLTQPAMGQFMTDGPRLDHSAVMASHGPWRGTSAVTTAKLVQPEMSQFIGLMALGETNE